MQVCQFSPPQRSLSDSETKVGCLFVLKNQSYKSQHVTSKGKGKVKVGFLYSAAYAMTGPARFSIS